MRRSTPRVRTVDGWNNVIFVDPKSIWSRGLHLRVNATLLCFVRQLRLIIHRKAIDKSENLTYVVGRPCLSARPIVYELYDFIEYERLLITRVQYETLLKYVFLYNARRSIRISSTPIASPLVVSQSSLETILGINGSDIRRAILEFRQTTTESFLTYRRDEFRRIREIIERRTRGEIRYIIFRRYAAAYDVVAS